MCKSRSCRQFKAASRVRELYVFGALLIPRSRVLAAAAAVILSVIWFACARADVLYAVSSNGGTFYTMGLDGTNPRVLNNLGQAEFSVAINPTAGKAYISTGVSTYSINLNGSNPSPISTAAGSWLNYDRALNEIIYGQQGPPASAFVVAMNPLTGVSVPLFGLPSNNTLGGVRLTPTGQVLYAVNSTTGGNTQIWEANLNGSGAHVVFDTGSASPVIDFDFDTITDTYVWDAYSDGRSSLLMSSSLGPVLVVPDINPTNSDSAVRSVLIDQGTDILYFSAPFYDGGGIFSVDLQNGQLTQLNICCLLRVWAALSRTSATLRLAGDRKLCFGP